MHIAAARVGYKMAMVGTWWAYSCLDGMDRLGNTTLTL